MIQLYDSLKGEKVTFEKKTNETVGMYVCGPTVYDNGHLGHGRSAVAFDIVRRTLLFNGYNVNFVFNYTDIDDKMINRANKEGITVAELADRISPLYDEDYSLLGVMPPSHNPKATQHIDEMISIIETLESKGHTYLLEDGVYFDITTFKDYGKLSHQNIEELNAGARIEERKDKKNHQDFVLWKLKKENEPYWSSPWGDGRPGWHIECSAMSRTLLGDTFDIHGGGLDLKFPHHECEIAQSEAANSTTFAKYWMHNGYITVDSEKMSKSLGNFFTLKDIFKKYHPRVVRFFLLSAHYRSPIEFNEELLEQARQTLRGLDDFYLKNQAKGIDEVFIKKVKEKINNDFDTAGTIATLFEWIQANPTQIRGTLDKLNELLNIFPTDFTTTPQEQALIKQREEARANKNWDLSDKIREELSHLELEDTAEGTIAKPRI